MVSREALFLPELKKVWRAWAHSTLGREGGVSGGADAGRGGDASQDPAWCRAAVGLQGCPGRCPRPRAPQTGPRPGRRHGCNAAPLPLGTAHGPHAPPWQCLGRVSPPVPGWVPGPHGPLTSSQQGLMARTAVPAAGSEGRQPLLPWLRRRGVVQDPLELQLQVPRLEQAGAFIQPHLEEAALVVHGHVPALRQVLQDICEGPMAEAAPGGQPLPSRLPPWPPPTSSVAGGPCLARRPPARPPPTPPGRPAQGWTGWR